MPGAGEVVCNRSSAVGEEGVGGVWVREEVWEGLGEDLSLGKVGWVKGTVGSLWDGMLGKCGVGCLGGQV